jgi:hypothetical protein
MDMVTQPLEIGASSHACRGLRPSSLLVAAGLSLVGWTLLAALAYCLAAALS